MNRRVLFFAAAAIILAASAATAVYAADQWLQPVCSKCGWHGPKSVNRGQPSDIECFQFKDGKQCGGLVKYTPCSPPG